MFININTSGANGCKVKVERATKGNPTSFINLGTYDISGWSGWNSIPLPNIMFGGGQNQTANTGFIRFTFTIGTMNENYTNVLTVSDLVLLGDTYWTTPSTMAKTGHLYTYDTTQSAVFPANVTASTFIGNLNGVATKAIQDGSGNIIIDTYATKISVSDQIAEALASLTNAEEVSY